MSKQQLPRGRCVDGGTDAHEWQPLSFAFENQLLTDRGQVQVRQPDPETGRVYCVCMKCHQHSYVITRFVGFYLGDPAVAGYFDSEDS